MLHRYGLAGALGHNGKAFADRAAQDAGCGHGHRCQHTDCVMAHMRNEAAGGDGAAGARWRDQGHLGVVFGRDVAQAHGMPGHNAQAFNAIFKIDVGVQLGHTLVAAATHIGSPEDHQRHAVVDTGHLQTERRVISLRRHLQYVLHRCGWQKPRRDGAGRVQKIDADWRTGSRHAVHMRVPGVFDIATARAWWRLHRHITLHTGIECEHAVGAGITLRLHQRALQREGNDGCQHVAAIGRRIDRIPVWL